MGAAYVANSCMHYVMGALAIVAGGYLAYLEVFGVYEYMTASGAAWNYIMQMTIGIAAIFAMLPAFASLAWKIGKCGAAVAIWVAFLLVGAIIFFAGLSRSGSSTDGAQLDRNNAALDRRLAEDDEKSARKRLETDQANVDRECANVPRDRAGKLIGSAIGPQCKLMMEKRDASQAHLDAAVTKLRGTKGGLRDAAGARIELYTFGYVTEQQFRDASPVLVPFVAMLLSATMMHLGIALVMGERGVTQGTKEPITTVLRPKAKTIDLHPAQSQTAVPAVNGADYREKVCADGVVTFLGERLRPAKGKRTSWAQVYKGFIDWHAASLASGRDPGSLLDEMQFEAVMHYLCNRAGISIQKRGATVYCLDRRLSA